MKPLGETSHCTRFIFTHFSWLISPYSFSLYSLHFTHFKLLISLYSFRFIHLNTLLISLYSFHFTNFTLLISNLTHFILLISSYWVNWADSLSPESFSLYSFYSLWLRFMNLTRFQFTHFDLTHFTLLISPWLISIWLIWIYSFHFTHFTLLKLHFTSLYSSSSYWVI